MMLTKTKLKYTDGFRISELVGPTIWRELLSALYAKHTFPHTVHVYSHSELPYRRKKILLANALCMHHFSVGLKVCDYRVILFLWEKHSTGLG